MSESTHSSYFRLNTLNFVKFGGEVAKVSLKINFQCLPRQFSIISVSVKIVNFEAPLDRHFV